MVWKLDENAIANVKTRRESVVGIPRRAIRPVWSVNFGNGVGKGSEESGRSAPSKGH